jgi:hypothetical protein
MLEPVFTPSIPFFSCYVNDLICVPFWLPIALFIQKSVRMRLHDHPPENHEILIHLAFISVMFEMVYPFTVEYEHVLISDPNDITFYALGALMASIFWKFYYEKTVRSDLFNRINFWGTPQ